MLRVAIQMDPIESINPKSDTTLLLGLEAQARGHTLWYYTPDKMSWREGKIIARASRITLHPNPEHYFDLGAEETLDLSTMDVILLRQDPPFNMAYLSTTYMLESLQLKTKEVVCDQGSDLKNGLATYRQKHPQLLVLHDMAHHTANEMKRELLADERWAKFIVATGQAKQRLIMTPLAHLVPPKLRSKARYMNLQELIAWGQDLLRYLDHPHPVDGQTPDPVVLRNKLGWLYEYREALSEWGAAMSVVTDTLSYIRRAGYHDQAVNELGPQLLPARSAMAHRVALRILAFIAAQAATLPSGQHLPGSSECLESLIGKGKRLEGQQSQSGFTKMILGLAAAVVKPTTEYLTAALSTVKTADVLNWCRDRLGTSLAAKRHRALVLSTGTNLG